MCGIAGYVTGRPLPPNRGVLERMTDSIRHRGPDESGYYQDEWASLGHRRLSKRPGWFVPVTTLLDYIQTKRGPVTLAAPQRQALERQWLAHKIRYGVA